jgi:acyl-CoA synthetase (AMP-forming)/AMP-acid ligase II
VRAPVAPQALRRWCRQRLEGFKVPKQVVIVDELPRSATGKLLRDRLDTSGALGKASDRSSSR